MTLGRALSGPYILGDQDHTVYTHSARGMFW